VHLTSESPLLSLSSLLYAYILVGRLYEPTYRFVSSHSIHNPSGQIGKDWIATNDYDLYTLRNISCYENTFNANDSTEESWCEAQV
jgi:hypothetical protein